MKKSLVLMLTAGLAIVAAGVVTAQKNNSKEWTKWSKKEAEKVLSDSPWSHVQTETDTSEMFYSPTNDPRLGGRVTSTTGPRSSEGAVNSSVSVSFHVRFFSARPVRQALARMIEINQKPPADVVAKLRQFAELRSPDSIIVTVTFDSPDQRFTGVVIQAFNSAVTANLKNDVYLQRADGKQLFLEEYVPPGKDGFGARFIFLREPDGQPFIKDKTGEIRFYAKYSNGIKIDRRFKLADMMYEGELEY
jgi:hypothetical protein